MTNILEFDKPYLPCIDAAAADVENAEVDYVVCGKILRESPCAHNAERARAGRERYFNAKELLRVARLRRLTENGIIRNY